MARGERLAHPSSPSLEWWAAWGGLAHKSAASGLAAMDALRQATPPPVSVCLARNGSHGSSRLKGSRPRFHQGERNEYYRIRRPTQAAHHRARRLSRQIYRAGAAGGSSGIIRGMLFLRTPIRGAQRRPGVRRHRRVHGGDQPIIRTTSKNLPRGTREDRAMTIDAVGSYTLTVGGNICHSACADKVIK